MRVHLAVAAADIEAGDHLRYAGDLHFDLDTRNTVSGYWQRIGAVPVTRTSRMGGFLVMLDLEPVPGSRAVLTLEAGVSCSVMRENGEPSAPVVVDHLGPTDDHGPTPVYGRGLDTRQDPAVDCGP